jgi:hypothetical protein
MFLEPTCPYSNKAFGKIKEVLSTAGEDKLRSKSGCNPNRGISIPA